MKSPRGSTVDWSTVQSRLGQMLSEGLNTVNLLLKTGMMTSRINSQFVMILAYPWQIHHLQLIILYILLTVSGVSKQYYIGLTDYKYPVLI